MTQFERILGRRFQSPIYFPQHVRAPKITLKNALKFRHFELHFWSWRCQSNTPGEKLIILISRCMYPLEGYENVYSYSFLNGQSNCDVQYWKKLHSYETFI